MDKTTTEKLGSEAPHSPAATRSGQGRLVGGCLIALFLAILVSLGIYALLMFSGRPRVEDGALPQPLAAAPMPDGSFFRGAGKTYRLVGPSATSFPASTIEAPERHDATT